MYNLKSIDSRKPGYVGFFQKKISSKFFSTNCQNDKNDEETKKLLKNRFDFMASFYQCLKSDSLNSCYSVLYGVYKDPLEWKKMSFDLPVLRYHYSLAKKMLLESERVVIVNKYLESTLSKDSDYSSLMWQNSFNNSANFIEAKKQFAGIIIERIEYIWDNFINSEDRSELNLASFTK